MNDNVFSRNKWILISLVSLIFFFSLLLITLSVHAEPELTDGLWFDTETGELLYHTDGQPDPSYNGFAFFGDESGDHWFYVEQGKVSFTKDDVIRGTIDGESGWYLVRNSEFLPATTVAKNVNGWWYVDNGKVDFSYQGFGCNEYGWWYLESGKVSFNVNDILRGFANNDPEKEGEDGWWYVRGSKVTLATTVAKNVNGWWYVEDGKVDFTHNSVEKNENGWWYIHGGQVDFSYNGFERNSYGWWYLENGKVTFNKNDILRGIANNEADKEGEDGWWYVRESKVTSTETVAKNVNGWWYVIDGKVDFTFTGIKKNEYGWWRIVNGQVDFNCNSVEENEYGWWKIVNGKVDFSFNGLAKNSNGWWYLKEGKIDFTYNGPAINYGNGYHVINGYVDWGYSGTFTGTTSYTVKGGCIVSSWINYNGAKYYCLASGKLATESVTVNGKAEVFHTDGRWIDTSSMDSKAYSYYSSSNYLILVSISNRVTKIYYGSQYHWTPVKNYLCTVGDPSKGWDTIKGDHYIGKSSWGNPTWKGPSFVDSEGHTLYYWTRFCDSFLFHSMLYDYNSYNLSRWGNDLGAAQSHGCVRLRIENAQWIYNYIPYGTRVIVY